MAKEDIKIALMKIADIAQSLKYARTEKIVGYEQAIWKIEQKNGYRNPAWLKIVKKEREQREKLEDIQHFVKTIEELL
jgi:DNA-directed RNA polymerase alpha subunit